MDAAAVLHPHVAGGPGPVDHGGRGVCPDGGGGVQGPATPGRSPYIYCRYIEQEHGGRGVCLDGGGGVQGPATPGRSA